MRPCDDSASRKSSGLKARATATGFEFGEEGQLAGFSGQSETHTLLRRIARQGRRPRRHRHGLGASPPRPRQFAFSRRARPHRHRPGGLQQGNAARRARQSRAGAQRIRRRGRRQNRQAPEGQSGIGERRNRAGRCQTAHSEQRQDAALPHRRRNQRRRRNASALPQSPQIFKQILMIGGLDRYFQIVKCFRDEDLRADRQPEFTQLDLEMSFPRQEDIFGVIEKVMVRACAVAGIKAEAPFPRMVYKDVIRKYGSDKPDLRFGMELHDVTNCFPEEAKQKLQIEGSVFALAAPGAAGYSRKQLDDLTEKAKALKARGAYFVKVAPEGLTSTVEKLIGAENVKKLAEACGAKPGDLVVAVSAKEQIKGTEAAALIAGQLRLQLGEALGVIDKSQWKFLWLTGFPLFEWSEADKLWVSAQHPFTGIVDEDLEKLESAPWEVRSKGYDLVLNGYELGSGSIRIHRQDVQERLFKAL